MRRALLLVVLSGLAISLLACGPEAGRVRGGGRGADVGNRDDVIQLHGDEPGTDRMYYLTPQRRPQEN